MVRIVFLWMLFETFYLMAVSTDWPIKRKSHLEGDFIIGGFFPIHARENDYMCGRLKAEGLIELEAMLFTVQKINKDPKILPDHTIGILAVDSCDSVPYSLEGAIDFAKGFIVKEAKYKYPNSKYFVCENGSHPVYENGVYENVIGVVGGHSSWVSMQIADLLQNYKMPQVSYMSTNPVLSDKNKYKYFFRSVPPLYHQSEGILAILREFNWLYISVIYADSSYGNNGFKHLKKKAKEKKDYQRPICFSYEKRINVENSKDKDYDLVIENLLRRNATAVVVFGDSEMARNLMSAATRANIYDRFVWIGSSAWAGRKLVTSGNEQLLEGAVGISHESAPLQGFEEYLKSLNLIEHQKINPWFPEYWEEQLNCKLTEFNETPYNRNYSECSQKETKLSSHYYQQSAPSVQTVSNAVYAIAHALHNKLEDCPEILSINNCTDLKKYLENVTFKVGDNKPLFRFDEKGDGPVRYSVINFQKVKEGSEDQKKNPEGSKYSWITVGSYTNPKGSVPDLVLDNSKMIFKQSKIRFPESHCSPDCKKGQSKQKLDDAGCCWYCIDCTEYQYVEDRNTSSKKTDCDVKVIALEYMTISNLWAILCVCFSLFGIIMTLCVGGILWKYWNTPVFMVSGRELSCILLIGITFLFTLTFWIVSKPSAISCGISRFFPGFFYTVSYAAIIAKTHLISNLRRQKELNKKPEPVNAKSLLLVVLGLISVAGTINAAWMTHSPPTTDYHRLKESENILICKKFNRTGYLIGFVYPLFLMLFSTAYAFKNREFKGAFNESRYINFTNYTTFVLWLAFLPIFLLNHRMYLRLVVLSLFLNVSALVQLVCLFLPKAYIALRRPEKNVHENVMCYGSRQSVAVN